MNIPTVDRRAFMALLAGSAALPLLGSKSARAQDSKVLIGVIEEDPATMNAGTSTVISGMAACAPVYNGLLRWDSKGATYPELADTWDVSPDGTTYTFHLHPGVKWHDGTPFTSADVKFTIDEMLSKLQPIGKNAYKFFDHSETPDDLTVVLVLKQPYAPFLSLPNAFWPILPKHLWEGTQFPQNPHDKEPVGTGAYKFAEYAIGDRIRYVKNEEYFQEGLPKFDEVVLRIIPDPAARVAAFENDEIDIIYSLALPFTEIARLSALPDVTGVINTFNGGAWVGFINTKSGPYADKRVRKALAHTIDRTFIRDAVLPGISDNMIGPLPPAFPLANKELQDYALDPAAANALLDEAGYARGADGTRFELRFLWSTSYSAVAKMGDIILQNLAAVGIKVVLTPLERQTLIDRGYINGEFDMIVDSFALGPDPDFGTERLYNSANITPGPFDNTSAYANPELDKLFDEQRTQTDFAKRKEIYDKIQAILWDDLPVLPICAYSPPNLVHGNRVSGVYLGWNPISENYARAEPIEA